VRVLERLAVGEAARKRERAGVETVQAHFGGRAQQQHVLCTGAEHVLLLRYSAEVRLHGLDTGTFAFARSLADGETLEDAHETALAAASPFDLSMALARLAALNLFTDFRR